MRPFEAYRLSDRPRVRKHRHYKTRLPDSRRPIGQIPVGIAGMEFLGHSVRAGSVELDSDTAVRRDWTALECDQQTIGLAGPQGAEYAFFAFAGLEYQHLC